MERKRETILRQKEEAKLNVKQYENKLKPLGNRKQQFEETAYR